MIVRRRANNSVFVTLQVYRGEWQTAGTFDLNPEEWDHVTAFCERQGITIYPEGAMQAVARS